MHSNCEKRVLLYQRDGTRETAPLIWRGVDGQVSKFIITFSLYGKCHNDQNFIDAAQAHALPGDMQDLPMHFYLAQVRRIYN